MSIQWNHEIEAAYQRVVQSVPAGDVDAGVTAVCDAVEAACGNRHAAADFPLRFVVAALLASPAALYSVYKEAEQHNAETGACTCQSTSHEFKDGRVKCQQCDHIAHGTRQFCGALR